VRMRDDGRASRRPLGVSIYYYMCLFITSTTRFVCLFVCLFVCYFSHQSIVVVVVVVVVVDILVLNWAFIK